MVFAAPETAPDTLARACARAFLSWSWGRWRIIRWDRVRLGWVLGLGVVGLNAIGRGLWEIMVKV